jgi:hypothetical protein
MAFLKTARAVVVHPHVNPQTWAGLRKTASIAPAQSVATQAQEILGGPLDPSRYLVTHCTIVASVDTKPVPGVKTGTIRVGSKVIDRRWPDYLITPETEQFINGNRDAFPRDVLLKSYRTFIGAQNYREHLQLESESKGRVIDAVARDIGESVYVDILVATDRKHEELVRQIESGALSTLSMGCFVPGTMVSLADGTRIPIEEVQPGEMVLTHKGRAREVLDKQIRYGKWNLRHINIVGVNDQISATDTHPFFVYRPLDKCACGCGEDLPEYKQVRNRRNATRQMSRRFKTGHDKNVFNPNNVYSIEEHTARKNRLAELKAPRMEELPAADLRVGDFLCFPRVQNAGSLQDGVTVGKGRLLGYFLAEGSYIKHKGQPREVQFSFSLPEKDTYAKEVCGLLEREFPTANKPWVQVREDRNTCIVHCTGADMVQWFFRHAGEYGHKKRLSAEAMTWPTEVHNHIVGTWISGDGCLVKGRGNVSATTTSYDLACQMHLLMANMGLSAAMRCRMDGHAVEVAQAVNGGVVQRGENGRLASFTLEIGQTQATKLAPYTDKSPTKSTLNEKHFRVLDDVIMFPITSIEDTAFDGWVYDLEVDEDHSYVVEGVAVHNCTCDATQCTKCGHVAVDETQLCDCVKYEKGNTFIDDQGNRRIIAELCGHPSLNDTGGVRFIEASWVAVPAFRGAVMRNVLSPIETIGKKAQEILASPPPQWTGHGGVLKAASEHMAFDMGDDSGGEDPGGGGGESPAEAKDPMAEAEEKLYTALRDRVVKRIEKDLSGKDDKPSQALPPAEGGSASTNENLTKMGGVKKLAYTQAVNQLVNLPGSNADFISGLVTVNSLYGVRLGSSVYWTAYQVGSANRYKTHRDFLAACHAKAGRKLSNAEVRAIIRIGSLLARRARHNTGD